MTDNSYNITITYDNNNFIFNGSDESGILNTAKYTLYFKTNSLIKFTLDFSNIDYDLSFIITTFNNETIINEGKHGGILELSSNSYIFYKFGPTLQSISGIIEIFSSSITNKEELINILNLKRNIVSDENVKSDLQIFNTDKRRFLGNFNYIISDNKNLVTDSSGIVDDLTIQSVNSDINLVTNDNKQIHFWCRETVVEEDLVIKGNLRMNYNKADFRNSDVSFNSVNIESKSGLTIQNEEVPTKNYLDSSFTLLTDFNDLSYNVSLIELRRYNDASLNNLDISGNLYIDNDLNINGILNVSGIDVYDRFTKLDISINTIDLKKGFDASFTNLDISGILNISGIDVYDRFTKLDISINSINNINTIDLKQGLDASFTHVDISGILNISGIDVYDKFTKLDISINNIDLKKGFDACFNNLADGQVLQYNSTTGLWENGTSGGGSAVLYTAYKTDFQEAIYSGIALDYNGFTTEIDTTGGAFNTATGEFTAPSDGYYRLNLQILIDKRNGNNMNYIVIRVKKDTGSGYSNFIEFFGNGEMGGTQNLNSHNVHQVINLNSGDKIKIALQLSSGSGAGLLWGFYAGTRYSTIAIEKI